MECFSRYRSWIFLYFFNRYPLSINQKGNKKRIRKISKQTETLVTLYMKNIPVNTVETTLVLKQK